MCIPTPICIPRACGGYLAYSQKFAPIKIGVTADTEAAALAKYHERYRVWLDLPEPDYEI